MRFLLCVALLFGSVQAYYDILLTLDHPYWGEAEYLITTKGDFNDDQVQDQTLQYGYWFAKGGYTFCTGHLSGLALRAGYSDLLMQWDNSPFFTENHFPSIDFSVGFFTACHDRWLWKVFLDASLQTNKISLGRNTLYTGAVWGRYCYSDCFGLHVGAYATLGIDRGFYRPIVGFDWNIWRGLCLKAVYPIDIALTYSVTSNFSVALAARMTRERCRLSRDNPVPEGMFEYRGWGGEGRITWCPWPFITAELYAGSFLAGWIRVHNSSDGRIAYRDLNANGYAGGHLAIHF